MEDKLKKIKEEYEKIEIPKELDDLIKKQIEKDKKIIVLNKKEWIIMTYKKIALTAAAFGLVFVVAINTSSAVAMAMYTVPVLGEIARVCTFREYKFANDAVDVDVTVPKIENTGNAELEERINSEINQKMEEVIADGEKRAKEYKQAVLETGGKPEDVHQVGVYADYEIKYSDESRLSFVITKVETMASAYSEAMYYNIDLKTGEDLKIVDVLGENYKEIVDKSVSEQIQERIKDENQIFFGTKDDDEMGIEGFVGIDENRTFYINEVGNVVVTFAKYEIAPGYMGMPEFEIVVEK